MRATWLFLLTSHFKLSPKDARAFHNHALCWSCAHGHLKVAQWLTSHFILSPNDARAIYEDTLVWSYVNTHSHVVQWLTSHFNLPPTQTP